MNAPRTPRTCRALLLTLGLALLVTLGAPPRAEAQLTFLSGMGYGALGGTIGLAATAGADCEGFVCIPEETVFATLGGLVIGSAVGASLGRRAERSVAAGGPADHLGAVAFGTVLGGAVTSMIVGTYILEKVDDRPGTILGDESQSAIILGATGAGLAMLYLRSRWGELKGGRAALGPALVGGELGVGGTLRF